MRYVLLINPNTSAATTAMMVAAARRMLPPGIALRGITAARGPAMITDVATLADAVGEVVRLGTSEASGVDALVVAAFGDPGLTRLRGLLPIPVVGIGEAAVRDAAKGGRRFGIATTTPGLVRSVEANIRLLGLEAGFTGVRIAEGDPVALAANPGLQAAALFRTVSMCLEADGAEMVVVGGGPLTDAAAQLARQFGDRIVEPVPAAVGHLLEQLRHPPGPDRRADA